MEGSCICFIDTGLNEEKVRAQFLSRGHKFSIPENFLSIRDFASQTLASFPSDFVGVALVGARPLHLLSQTVLPLKSPTGAFIAALHFANAVPPQTLLMVRTCASKKTTQEELCQIDTIPPQPMRINR